MKKVVFLAVTVLFLLVGCGGDGGSVTVDNSKLPVPISKTCNSIDLTGLTGNDCTTVVNYIGFTTEDFSGKTLYFLNGASTEKIYFREDGIAEMYILAAMLRTSDYTWEVVDGILVMKCIVLQSLENYSVLLEDNGTDRYFVISKKILSGLEKNTTIMEQKVFYDQVTGLDQARAYLATIKIGLPW